jgi:hypothetical protein
MRRIPLLASILLSACTSSDANRDAGPQNNDAGLESAAETAAETGHDAASESAAEGGPEAEAGDGSFKPSDIPSTRTVTVHVTNGLSAPVVLLDDATTCMTLKIERLEGTDWVDLPLDANSSYNNPNAFCCHTACDFDLHFTGREMQPGNGTSLQWDARALVFSEETYQCDMNALHWCAHQPVSAGSYRVSVIYHAPFQVGCEADAGVVSCGMSAMNTSYPMPFCGDLAIFTGEGFLTKSQTFELSDSGDTTVDVMLE